MVVVVVDQLALQRLQPVCSAWPELPCVGREMVVVVVEAVGLLSLQRHQPGC